MDAVWSTARGQLPGVTCNRSWISTGGNRRGFLVGCPLVAAAVLSFLYALAGGYNLILLLAPLSIVVGGRVGSLSLLGVRPSGMLLGCLLFTRVGTTSLLRSRGSGRFMMTSCVSWHRLMMRWHRTTCKAVSISQGGLSSRRPNSPGRRNITLLKCPSKPR